MSSTQHELTTSELMVLESLQGATEAISQRELARRTGFSVGLINAVLKKLINTGYIKTSHLNRRSIEYLLTPQGFAHAAMKSYRYVIDTVRKYRAIKTRLHGILEGLRREGFNDFFLHGDGELAEVVAMFFAEEGAGELIRGIIPRHLVKSSKLVVLNTEPRAFKSDGYRVVDLVREFANGHGAKGECKNAKPLDKKPSIKEDSLDSVKEFYDNGCNEG